MTDIARDIGSRRAARSRAWMLAGLAPGVLWQIVFFVVPLLLLSVYSFWSMQNYKIDHTFTFENYAEIFKSPLLFNALILSLKVAFVVTVACAAIAYPIAYFIAKKAGRWRTLCLIMVIIPFWTSFILRAYAWKLLLGDHGFINTGLTMAGVVDQPLSYLLYSPFATSIGLVYAFLPFYIMPLYSRIHGLPRPRIWARRRRKHFSRSLFHSACRGSPLAPYSHLSSLWATT